MVVPVLITSCHVSDHWNIGPEIAQTMIIVSANMKAIGRPVAADTLLATCSKNWFMIRPSTLRSLRATERGSNPLMLSWDAQTEMGAGIAASPHCAEHGYAGVRNQISRSFTVSRSWLTSSGVAFHRSGS